MRPPSDAVLPESLHFHDVQDPSEVAGWRHQAELAPALLKFPHQKLVKAVSDFQCPERMFNDSPPLPDLLRLRLSGAPWCSHRCISLTCVFSLMQRLRIKQCLAAHASACAYNAPLPAFNLWLCVGGRPLALRAMPSASQVNSSRLQRPRSLIPELYNRESAHGR